MGALMIVRRSRSSSGLIAGRDPASPMAI